MFVNFDEKEEATRINTLTFLRFRPLVAYVLLPVLSVLTVFILPICMYWNQNLQVRLLYKKATRADANYILVEGSAENTEIQPLRTESDKALVFIYRFIKFQYFEQESVFKPVIYDVERSYSDLIKLGTGLSESAIELLQEKYGPC
jgi:hypothetical protein